MATSLTSFDSATMGILCFYLFFINRNLEQLLMFMSVVAAICFGLSFFLLPESHKWLLAVGKTREAIQVFNYIARFNGSEKRITQDA